MNDRRVNVRPEHDWGECDPMTCERCVADWDAAVERLFAAEYKATAQ